MLITARVFTSLFTVGILAIVWFVVGDFALAATYEVNSFLDRLLRKIPTEQYLQLVVLPLCGAIAGGLISTAIPILLDHPWWKPDSRTYIALALIAIGLVVIVVGPLTVHILYANPKNLTIVIRIEQLKNGDWARDNKADVIKTIDEERVKIEKERNSKNIWFLASLYTPDCCQLRMAPLRVHRVRDPVRRYLDAFHRGNHPVRNFRAIPDAAKVPATRAEGPGLISSGGRQAVPTSFYSPIVRKCGLSPPQPTRPKNGDRRPSRRRNPCWTWRCSQSRPAARLRFFPQPGVHALVAYAILFSDLHCSAISATGALTPASSTARYPCSVTLNSHSMSGSVKHQAKPTCQASSGTARGRP